MFGDIFDNADDKINENAQNFAILNSEQRKPKNCAAYLDFPPFKRDKNRFIGLKNLGATCYLNSLFQTFFMSPEMRNAIFQLPLCKNDDLTQKSDFVELDNKFKILLAFQKLLVEMQCSDVSSVSTEEITKSFGWENNQELQQQDIQEALRVFFDVIDRALTFTSMKDSISSNYKGIMVNHITCLSCGTSREREEPFFDLMIQVKGYSCLEESLFSFVTPERLDGQNQYFCEICNSKTDALKGFKLRKFPNILTFSLNRFEFDFEKMDRVKINDQFAFGLEFDALPFLESQEEIQGPDDSLYELFAIVIHRGGAHGGHYYANIRDCLKESNWKEHMIKYAEQREKDKTRQAEKEREQQLLKESKEKMELEKQKSGEGENAVQAMECEKEQPSNDSKIEEETPAKEENEKRPNTRGKKNKQNKNNQQQQQNQSNKQGKGGRNTRNKDKKQENVPKVTYLEEAFFDEVDFPIAFKNEELGFHWYEFNDTAVHAIPVNRIQKQFGGNSGNAYILIYRKKEFLNKILDASNLASVPSYLQNYINFQNELVEKERLAYKEAERQIDILFVSEFQFQVEEKLFLKDLDLEKDCIKFRTYLDQNLSGIFNKVGEILNTPSENVILIELAEQKNKLIHLKRIIDASSLEKTAESLNFEHLGSFLILKKESFELNPTYKYLIGEDRIPIKLSGESHSLVTLQDVSISEFMIQVNDQLGINTGDKNLRIVKYENLTLLNHNDSFEKSLKQLGVVEGSDVLMTTKEEDINKKYENFDQFENLNDEEENMPENYRKVIVQRDDDQGFLIEWVDLEWTLEHLHQFLIAKFNLENDQKPRRLRKQFGNSLFYQEELSKTLRELEFEEGGIRLRLENGPVPNYGNIAIKIKIETKHLPGEPRKFDTVIFPGAAVAELLQIVCSHFQLKPEDHKFYKTDTFEEPTKAVLKIEKPLSVHSIKNNDLLVLKDNDAIVSKEMISFAISITFKGTPDDSTYLETINIKEDSTLGDLKDRILRLPYFQSFKQLPNKKKIRVREIKKDLFFGTLYSNDEKQLKKFKGISSVRGLVIQVLEKEEVVNDDDILLYGRKRNVAERTYGEYNEFYLRGSKVPKIENLKKSIITELNLGCSPDDLDIAKHFPYNYCWIKFDLKALEDDYEKKKKGNAGKKKSGKKKKEAKPQEVKPFVEDLRMAPFLLKDGDVIGYRFKCDDLEAKDDFQTLEDAKNKEESRVRTGARAKNNEPKKGNKEIGFKINTDF